MDCKLVIDMGLFNLFNRNQSNQRDRFVGGTEKMFPKWTTPPDRNSAEWMKGFGENPRMAVVDKIASDLSYVPGKLYRINQDGERQEVTDHPFLDFMAKPNPLHEFTASAVWRLQAIYLMLKGEGYFILSVTEMAHRRTVAGSDTLGTDNAIYGESVLSDQDNGRSHHECVSG